MVDLSHKASLQFWFEYKDPIIYRVITYMESVENWTIDDHPELEAAIKNLGEILDDVGNVDLQKEDELIKIAAYIKASRALRLLQAMDTAHPGAASKLLTHAEKHSTAPDDAPALFLRRNVIFERLRLLSRVFASERLALVQQALEDEELV